VSSPQNKSDKPLTPRHAWQPLTPRGVAAFAHATSTRLLIVQLVVAAIVTLAVLWFLRTAWFPVVLEAVQQLPETGAIHGGELDFGGSSPKRLAENARLAIIVDSAAAGTAGRTADLEVTFEKERVVICGTAGCWRRPYPRDYIISFNRAQVEAAWGAWRWAVIATVGLATFLLLLVMWWAVGLFYLPLVKVLALFADRRITWGGAWRLGCAALLPGALILAAGIILHGFGIIDLFRFALMYLLHVVAGLAFVVTSPFFLPTVGKSPAGRNPFGGQKSARPASPFSRPRDL
jgi:hypothetical protein